MFLFNIIIFVICLISLVLILRSQTISYAKNYVKVSLNIILNLFESSNKRERYI